MAPRVLFAWTWLTLTGMAATGCTYPRGWAYDAAPPMERPPLVAGTLVVPPLVDQRPADNADKVWLYLIPLMPYGWQDYQQPERMASHVNSGRWRFAPTEDIAKALAAEIANRRLIAEARFASTEEDADWVLRGGLSSLHYDGRLLTYGLSVAGPNLWLVGLPAGSVKNSLAMTLRLENRRSRTVVWEQRYDLTHDEGLFWLYSLAEDFWYDTMLKQLMPRILSDLEEALTR